MAVTVVQTAATSSTTTNPTLKYQARPTAGDFLLAYCMQESVTMPGTPTDTAGNTWQSIACSHRQPDSNAPSGLSLCVARVRLANAANTTVTFPTGADSLVAVQEFSGVLADGTYPDGSADNQPDSLSAGFAGPATDFYVGVSPSSASEYCQAIVVCLDQTVTWTLDTSAQYAGWTLDRTVTGGAGGSHVGMSTVLAHQVAGSFVVVHLIASKPVVACVLGLSLAAG